MILIGFLLFYLSCCGWQLLVLALGIGLVFAEGKQKLAPDSRGWFLFSSALRVAFGFTALFAPSMVVLLAATEVESRPPPAVSVAISAAAALLVSLAVNAAIWARRKK